MKLTNMSKIGPQHVLTFAGPTGMEYWIGGTDFSHDIEQANLLGTGAAMHFMGKLMQRNIGVACKVVESNITLMHWPDIGWVVMNHREWPTTVHRVYLNNAYGEGWYFKDEGSVERKLCMNRSLGCYLDLVVRGREIVSSTMRVDGETIENFNSFTIPYESDLIYQFAFDPTPVEL